MLGTDSLYIEQPDAPVSTTAEGRVPLAPSLPGTFQALGPRASLPAKLNLGSEIRNSSDSAEHSLAAVAVPTKELDIQGAGDRPANATHSG